jgi:hypothetical protein
MSDEGGGGTDGGAPDGPDPKGASGKGGASTRSGPASADSDNLSRVGSGSSASSEAVGPDLAGTEVYTAGRDLLSPMTVSAARDAHVTYQAHIVMGTRDVTTNPGPVPLDRIEALRASYVPVAGYEAFEQALRSKRLLVLVGPHSSGRSTTGLHLLDVLADGAVSRLDPTTRLATIDEQHIASGQGYLGEIDLAAGEHGRVAADRVAALLERQQSFCVLIARPSPGLRRAMDRYWAECPPVDPMEVLAQHLEAGITTEDDPLLGERTAELATRDDIRDLLGPAACPAQVAEIAELLLSHERGERGMDAVRARAEALVLDERIEEWFAVLVGATHGIRAERARRLTATRIAVAVFDGMPRHIAESTAEDLAVQMGTPHAAAAGSSDAAPFVVPRTSARLLDPDDTFVLQASTPIEFLRLDVPHAKGMVPGEVVRYLDPRMPAAVLRSAWSGQYALRSPMITWLDGLSRDPRYDVRLRAAQAAGLLTSIDFTHAVDALIMPAATAQPEAKPALEAADREEEDDGDEEFDTAWQYRRHFAAVAMDHTARDLRLREAVRRRLSYWRRSDDSALRWTAAIALGYDVGARAPGDAFEDLRVLGTPWEARRFRELEAAAHKAGKRTAALRREDEVFHAAGSGVAGLFRSGAHLEVLDQLRKWMDHPRRSLRLLADQAVIYIMQITVATVGRPEAGDGARLDALVTDADRQKRARWPVLLAVHDRQNPVTGPAADLVRRTLRSRDRRVALDVLSDWLEFAGEDDAVLAALEVFLPLLVVEESERSRLRGLVGEMRLRWEDPLPAAAADRLEGVIAGITLIAGRKVFV